LLRRRERKGRRGGVVREKAFNQQQENRGETLGRKEDANGSKESHNRQKWTQPEVEKREKKEIITNREKHNEKGRSRLYMPRAFGKNPVGGASSGGRCHWGPNPSSVHQSENGGSRRPRKKKRGTETNRPLNHHNWSQ